MIRIMVSNLDRLVKTIGDAVSAAIAAGLEEAAQKIEKELVADSADFRVTGDFQRSWQHDPVTRVGHVYSTKVTNEAPYATTLEFGRKPGSLPNFDAIAEWAYARGIIGELPESYIGGPRDIEWGPSLEGGLSVGKRKLRRARAPRKERYQFDEEARIDMLVEHPEMWGWSDEKKVYKIMGAIATKGTEGKYVLNNAKRRERNSRIVRDTIRKHLKHLTKAKVT